MLAPMVALNDYCDSKVYLVNLGHAVFRSSGTEFTYSCSNSDTTVTLTGSTIGTNVVHTVTNTISSAMNMIERTIAC